MLDFVALTFSLLKVLFRLWLDDDIMAIMLNVPICPSGYRQLDTEANLFTAPVRARAFVCLESAEVLWTLWNRQKRGRLAYQSVRSLVHGYYGRTRRQVDG